MTFTVKRITLALVVALSTFATQALAQDKVKDKENEPAKSGAAPAVDLFPKGYLNHQGLSAAIKKVADANPGRVKARSIAKSG